MDEASGRGWAQIDGDGKLHGHIFFHNGDDSSFVARKSRGGAGEVATWAMNQPVVGLPRSQSGAAPFAPN